MTALREQVLRRKPVAEMAAETGADTGTSELKRTIGLWSLSAIGIGGTIGTGIFFILSQAVPMAGPAVVWSFAIAGAVAGLTAVCYAELASAVPVAASSPDSTAGRIPSPLLRSARPAASPTSLSPSSITARVVGDTRYA